MLWIKQKTSSSTFFLHFSIFGSFSDEDHEKAGGEEGSKDEDQDSADESDSDDEDDDDDDDDDDVAAPPLEGTCRTTSQTLSSSFLFNGGSR